MAPRRKNRNNRKQSLNSSTTSTEQPVQHQLQHQQRCSDKDTVFLPIGSETTLENVIERINVLEIDFSKKN